MSDRSGSDLAVDVVVCNHDYGRFVTEAVESALAQTHPRVKVVVVDDGSSDGSRELLRGFEGRVDLVLKENGGQASAFNAGMARSEGDVVIFLDADDRLRPQAAALVAGAFAADPGLAKVQFPMAVIDAQGHPTGLTKPNDHLRPPTGDMRRAELAFPFDIPWMPGGGTAFSGGALREILPVPEREYPRYGADWYLVHLTALLGTAGSLDEVCAEYRVHGRNAYERQEPTLDLTHVRDTVVFGGATIRELTRLADELGLDRPDPILSLSDIGNRLLSLRLEPRRHPRPEDRAGALVADAIRATRRRFDVSAPMKLALVAWALAVAVSPKPVVRRLGEILLYPEGRHGSVNRLLGRLRRDGGAPAVAPRA